MNIKDTKKAIKENNPTFGSRPHICYLPWIHLEASAIGEIKPCCMAEHPIVDLKTGEPLNLATDTLSDAYHSKFMAKLRLSMLAGQKPAICTKCWDEEEAGVVSKRLIFAEEYSQKPEYHGVFTTPIKDENLTFLDLKLGNICNLKCRICGPESSSTWVKDEIEMDVKYNNFDPKDKKEHRAYKWSKDGQWPRNNDKFWSELEVLLPQITHLEFTGGEPWMIKEHFDLLETAVAKGYAKNIKVHYNTNGTQYSRHAIENIWPYFKEIDIAFSIDDVDHQFEYQRSGANWEEVLENIRLVCTNKTPNVTTEVCTTISILNAHRLPHLAPVVNDIDGLDSWYLNLLQQPEMYRISIASDAHKEFITTELLKHDWNAYDHLYGDKQPGTVAASIENFINYMNTNEVEDAVTARAELCENITRLDLIRKESLENIDPTLYGFLDAVAVHKLSHAHT